MYAQTGAYTVKDENGRTRVPERNYFETKLVSGDKFKMSLELN